MFKPFYLTYSDYELNNGDGRVFDETRPDQSFEDVVSDIMQGDREWVVSVYYITPDAAPQDVSAEVAEEIQRRVWSGHKCSRSACKYLEAQGMWTESEAAE